MTCLTAASTQTHYTAQSRLVRPLMGNPRLAARTFAPAGLHKDKVIIPRGGVSNLSELWNANGTDGRWAADLNFDNLSLHYPLADRRTLLPPSPPCQAKWCWTWERMIFMHAQKIPQLTLNSRSYLWQDSLSIQFTHSQPVLFALIYSRLQPIILSLTT